MQLLKERTGPNYHLSFETDSRTGYSEAITALNGIGRFMQSQSKDISSASAEQELLLAIEKKIRDANNAAQSQRLIDTDFVPLSSLELGVIGLALHTYGKTTQEDTMSMHGAINIESVRQRINEGNLAASMFTHIQEYAPDTVMVEIEKGPIGFAAVLASNGGG